MNLSVEAGCGWEEGELTGADLIFVLLRLLCSLHPQPPSSTSISTDACSNLFDASVLEPSTMASARTGPSTSDDWMIDNDQLAVCVALGKKQFLTINSCVHNLD
jgi:hypothetical protein